VFMKRRTKAFYSPEATRFADGAFYWENASIEFPFTLYVDPGKNEAQEKTAVLVVRGKGTTGSKWKELHKVNLDLRTIVDPDGQAFTEDRDFTFNAEAGKTPSLLKTCIRARPRDGSDAGSDTESDTSETTEMDEAVAELPSPGGAAEPETQSEDDRITEVDESRASELEEDTAAERASGDQDTVAHARAEEELKAEESSEPKATAASLPAQASGAGTIAAVTTASPQASQDQGDQEALTPKILTPMPSPAPPKSRPPSGAEASCCRPFCLF